MIMNVEEDVGDGEVLVLDGLGVGVEDWTSEVRDEDGRGVMKGAERVSAIISAGTVAAVTDAAGADVVSSPSSLRTFASAVDDGRREISKVAEGTTTALAAPMRRDRPSNVTRAFSERQDRFAALKRARITVEKSGIEKLDCADWIRRGMESPNVTLG